MENYFICSFSLSFNDFNTLDFNIFHFELTNQIVRRFDLEPINIQRI